MKYAKAHTKLLYGISLVVAIVSFLLIEFATPYVINAFYAHWAVLLVVLLFCVIPFGNKKLSAHINETPRYDVWHWLLRLLLLQLSLFFIFLGIALVFSYWLPVKANAYPTTIPQTFQTFLKKDGLLPWAIYALYAVGLGVMAYIKNQEGHSGDLLLPVFHKKHGSLLSNALNLQARSAVLIAIATTFAFMVLLFTTAVLPQTKYSLIGFHIKTLIIIFALVLFGFTTPFKKVMKVLLIPKIPLYITTASTLIILALSIWIWNEFLGHLGESTVTIPKLIEWLQRKNTMQLWILFSAAWWIGWAPLIAAHIARISRGYRVRSVLLATLFLPFLFTLLFIIFPSVLPIFQRFPLVTSILALISFVYLLKILTEKTVLPMMIRSYLPKQDSYKRRDHYFYFRKLFQLTFIIIYLYLPAGMSVTILLTFTLTLSFTLQIPLYLIYITVKGLFKRH